MRPTGPSNELLRETLNLLRSKARERPLWGRVAELMSRPARRRPVANISKINRYSEDGDIVIVPGKVLGTGYMKKKVTVVAFSFSKQAAEKISRAGGRVLTLREAVDQLEDFSKVKIIA